MTRGSTSSHLPAPSSTTAQLLNASFRKIVGHGPVSGHAGVVQSASKDERLDGLGAGADLAEDLPVLDLGVGLLARSVLLGVGGVDVLLVAI
jgi:hypothetical protein